jgi:hypothetical protein
VLWNYRGADIASLLSAYSVEVATPVARAVGVTLNPGDLT